MKIIYVMIFNVVMVHSIFGQYSKKSVSKFELTSYTEMKTSGAKANWYACNSELTLSSEQIVLYENGERATYKVIDFDLATRSDYSGVVFGAYCRDDSGGFVYISIGLSKAGHYAFVFERDGYQGAVAFAGKPK